MPHTNPSELDTNVEAHGSVENAVQHLVNGNTGKPGWGPGRLCRAWARIQKADIVEENEDEDSDDAIAEDVAASLVDRCVAQYKLGVSSRFHLRNRFGQRSQFGDMACWPWRVHLSIDGNKGWSIAICALTEGRTEPHAGTAR